MEPVIHIRAYNLGDYPAAYLCGVHMASGDKYSFLGTGGYLLTKSSRPWIVKYNCEKCGDVLTLVKLAEMEL